MTILVALGLLLTAGLVFVYFMRRPGLASLRKTLWPTDPSDGDGAAGLEEVRLTVDVAENNDPQEVKAILLQAATACPEVLLDPPPRATVVEQGRDTVKFELVVCRRERPDSLRALLSTLYRAIFQAFRNRRVRLSRR